MTSYLGDRLLERKLLRRRPWLGRVLDHRRRSLLESSLRRRARAVYVGDGVVLALVLGRYKMYVPADDLSVAAHLIADGFWEIWIVEVLVELLGHAMVTVDAGANVGFFSMVMADFCPEGHVHSFEPNSALVPLLSRSLIVNGFADRVTLHEVALGGSEDVLQLVVPERQIGGGYVVSDPSLDGAVGRPVPVRRLDAVPGARDAEFVKIDAEGSEPAIWAGMTDMIAGTRLHSVLLEFAPARYDEPGAFLDTIRAAGFSLSRIDHNRGIVATTADTLLSGPLAEHMLLLRR